MCLAGHSYWLFSAGTFASSGRSRGHAQGGFAHFKRQGRCGSVGVGPFWADSAENSGKLCWIGIHGPWLWLPRHDLPSCYQGLHHTGRRLRTWRWHGRLSDFRQEAVCRRELRASSRLSMANAGKDTNGAQFFITTSESSTHLNGHHVVFGQLVGGFEVLDLLNTAPTGENDRPVSRWAIEDADIFVEPPAETGSLGSYRFFMGLCLVSSVCYAAVQWNHRRKKVVITGFRSM